MKLFVAGGCGEHGRNCFFVDCGGLCFLVDCGILAGEPGGGTPHLTKEQIAALDFVLLTHSHADHTGAVPWLYAQGCRAPLIATWETFAQCGPALAAPDCRNLGDLCPGGRGHFKNADILWGRTGHCAGSVWYKITTGGKTILFSGDYTEDARLYRCDKLRGQTADLAVLDCAYGNDRTPFADCCERLVESTRALLARQRTLLFPVPKYGRGPELLSLFCEALPGVRFYGDALFRDNLQSLSTKPFWVETAQNLAAKVERYAGQTDGIVFVSDPQLRTESAQKTAKELLGRGGYALATGTVEPGSYSAALISAGRMALCRYPVHLNRTGYELLKNANQFARTVPYHAAALQVSSPVEF